MQKLVEKDVTYQDGKTSLRGFLVYDESLSGPRPGILVTHNWLGLTEATKVEARKLARKGYVAFAVDIYGANVRPTMADAGALSDGYKKDRKLLRGRMEAGLKTLRAEKNVDSSKLAVIGFCFGGTAALELARDGAPLKGVVTFHGGLDSPTPADGKKIKGKVLALHGALDPFVTPPNVDAFEKEMQTNKVDYQLVKYGGTVHSFTDTEAGSDLSKGSAYNPVVATRAFAAMDQFFAEIFR